MLIRSASSPRAFTLIELLVVISIISLLVALLLPALARARDSGIRVKCLGNTQQNMLGLRMYSNDYQGNLPDEGVLGTDGDRTYIDWMVSPGGIGGTNVRRPSGLGGVAYGQYVPTLESFYCPAEQPDIWYIFRKTRPKILNQYDSSTFKTAVDNGTVDVFLSYNSRFKRWRNGGGQPALLMGAVLANLERYIYSFDRGPLARFGRVSLVSDTFQQKPDDVPGKNFIKMFHGDGVNVGYSDGSARWIRDKDAMIAGLITSFPAYIGELTMTGEDVWDAFDGDIGFDPFTRVDNIIR